MDTKDLAELEAKGYTLHTAQMSGGDMHDWEAEPILEGIYTLKEENQGLRKDQNVYHVKTEDGNTHRFWGSIMLNDVFKSIPLGYSVYIAYGGKKPSQSGGNPYHYFDVLSRKVE